MRAFRSQSFLPKSQGCLSLAQRGSWAHPGTNTGDGHMTSPGAGAPRSPLLEPQKRKQRRSGGRGRFPKGGQGLSPKSVQGCWEARAGDVIVSMCLG